VSLDYIVDVGGDLLTSITLRCNFPDCGTSVTGRGRSPTPIYDVLNRMGWEVLDTALLHSSSCIAACPAHRAIPGWESGEGITHRAKCHTCGEDEIGSQDQCREWAEDHECEPDTTVSTLSERERAREQARRERERRQ
jgi:hypothetical protein